MALAEQMRQQAVAAGDQAYGAIIVKNGEVIGYGPSKVIVDTDPTAHAEITAIRDASKYIQSSDLSGCEMYSTSRACAMCEAAAFWAGIDNMVYGESLNETGKPVLRRC